MFFFLDSWIHCYLTDKGFENLICSCFLLCSIKKNARFCEVTGKLICFLMIIRKQINLPIKKLPESLHKNGQNVHVLSMNQTTWCNIKTARVSLYLDMVIVFVDLNNLQQNNQSHLIYIFKSLYPFYSLHAVQLLRGESAN